METIKPYWLEQVKAERKSTANNNYRKSSWTKYSLNYRVNNPLCVYCKKINVISPAVLVDHIIRVNAGGSFWDSRNHQGLCRSCHDTKSFKERNRLTLPYEHNHLGEKIPCQGGDVSSPFPILTTPLASCFAQNGKIPDLFFHGGIVNQVQSKYRYDFNYFFASSNYDLAIIYQQLNKGHVYKFNCSIDGFVNFNFNATNSALYLQLIYQIANTNNKSVLIQNCTDMGTVADILLVTDFSLISNLTRL